MEGLNMLNPRQSLINDILKVAIKPENIGDLHLKMMLKYPRQFAIRKEMIEMFLTSFYKVLWNKDLEYSNKVELIVLTGLHKESAFVEVRSAEVLINLINRLVKSKN